MSSNVETQTSERTAESNRTLYDETEEFSGNPTMDSDDDNVLVGVVGKATDPEALKERRSTNSVISDDSTGEMKETEGTEDIGPEKHNSSSYGLDPASDEGKREGMSSESDSAATAEQVDFSVPLEENVVLIDSVSTTELDCDLVEQAKTKKTVTTQEPLLEWQVVESPVDGTKDERSEIPRPAKTLNMVEKTEEPVVSSQGDDGSLTKCTENALPETKTEMDSPDSSLDPLIGCGSDGAVAQTLGTQHATVSTASSTTTKSVPKHGLIQGSTTKSAQDLSGLSLSYSISESDSRSTLDESAVSDGSSPALSVLSDIHQIHKDYADELCQALDKLKSDMKDQLRKYNLHFARVHGNGLPSKAEREPIHNLYESYLALKRQIECIHQQKEWYMTLKPLSDAPSDAVRTEKHESPGQRMEALRVEKKEIHSFLRRFEKDFYQKNKRQVSTWADIQPVSSHYKRYKQIKKEMKALQKAKEV